MKNHSFSFQPKEYFVSLKNGETKIVCSKIFPKSEIQFKAHFFFTNRMCKVFRTENIYKIASFYIDKKWVSLNHLIKILQEVRIFHTTLILHIVIIITLNWVAQNFLFHIVTTKCWYKHSSHLRLMRGKKCVWTRLDLI